MPDTPDNNHVILKVPGSDPNQSNKDSKMKFVPCDGKCTEEGTHCEGCGRTHKEIAEMRKPVEELVALAEKMKYENLEDFANAVAGSMKYKLGLYH